MADQFPALEACGSLIRTKRTEEDRAGWLVAEVVLPGANCSQIAALFAATPDLLAAAQTAESFLAGFEDCDNPADVPAALATVRAALAKVGG